MKIVNYNKVFLNAKDLKNLNNMDYQLKKRVLILIRKNKSGKN